MCCCAVSLPPRPWGAGGTCALELIFSGLRLHGPGGEYRGNLGFIGLVAPHSLRLLGCGTSAFCCLPRLFWGLAVGAGGYSRPLAAGTCANSRRGVDGGIWGALAVVLLRQQSMRTSDA